MSSQTQCPLLALPAELRNQIYYHALHPTGTLTLTSTKTSRFAVQPSITPALLATCRQIHHEAKDLIYTENTVAITLDAHETYWPPIAEKRLPQHVLEKIQHLCVIFDCTGVFHARYSYEDVDFAAFEALISLKTLRIGIVYATVDTWGGQRVDRSDEMLTEILMRVPSEAKVLRGIDEESQEWELQEHVLSRRRQGKQDPSVIKAADKDELEAALMEVPGGVRGILNGDSEDVFAESRIDPESVGRRVAMI